MNKFFSFLLMISVSMCAFNSTIDSLYQVTQEGKDEEKAKAFYQLCIELNNKQPTKAINYANKGLSLAYQTNQIELQAKLHYQIGYSYMLIPDYTRALVDLKKGIAITEDINDIALCGQFAYQLGKRYDQDELLKWGCSVDISEDDLMRFKTAGHTMRKIKENKKD